MSQHEPPPPARAPGGTVTVELVRLAVVVLTTAAAFQVAGASVLLEAVAVVEAETLRLALTVLGAGVGYVVGGVLGRFALGRIDDAEARLARVGAGELLAGGVGGVVGLVVALGLAWPLLLVGDPWIGVPLAALVATLLVSAGLRIGLRRGGDLLRFVGAQGRLDVASPARGATAKVVDTSALVDGRVLDVCRAGFLEGTLVVPRCVLGELQGLADAADAERRRRGRRGLDVLAGLQRSAGVALEVSEEDRPEVADVDAKLVAIARDRGAALVTVDANLARVAEVQGIGVLSLAVLADMLRPPVAPGEVLEVRVAREGKEIGQGVGYLSDGTMVVVEGAAGDVGGSVAAEVTSILSGPRGRMVFATRSDVTRLPRDEGTAQSAGEAGADRTR